MCTLLCYSLAVNAYFIYKYYAVFIINVQYIYYRSMSTNNVHIRTYI